MTTDVGEERSGTCPPVDVSGRSESQSPVADLTEALIRLSASTSLDELAADITRCGSWLGGADGAAAVIWSDGGRTLAAAIDGERSGYPEVLDRAIRSAVGQLRTGQRTDGAALPRFCVTQFREPAPRSVTAAVPLAAHGGDLGAMILLTREPAAPIEPERAAVLRAFGAAAGGRIAHMPPMTGASSQQAASDAAVLEHDARAERRRIARELHDGLIQSLYGTGLAIRAQATRPDIPDRGRRTMQGWVERIEQIVDEARAYVDELEEAGDAVAELGAGLDAIADEAAAAGLDVYTEVTATEQVRPTPDVRREILRVAHEAVSNAVRHASARHIVLRVEMDPATDDVQLTVEDDGVGFDPAGGLPAGHGLRNMAARAAVLGGALDIVSRPAAGTKVRLRARLTGRSASPSSGH